MVNGFLSAEERLRLKCVFLHSERTAWNKMEMSHDEVGFVLGITRQTAQKIEAVALQKIKRHKNQYKGLED